MEKRVFSAILLSFLVYILWLNFTQKPPEEAEEPVQTPPASGPTDPGKPAEPDPATAPDPVAAAGFRAQAGALHAGELVLTDGTRRIAFDQKGAGISGWWLLDQEAQPGPRTEGFASKLQFIRRFDGGPLPLGLTDPSAVAGQAADWPDQILWDTTGIDPEGKSIAFSLRFEREGRHLRLEKRYTLVAAPNRLAVEFGLVDEDGTGQAAHAAQFQLRNSGGVWPADRSLSSQLPSHSLLGQFVDKSLTIQSLNTKDVLKEKSKFKTLPSAIFVGDMGFYFAAVLSRSSIENAASGRVLAIAGAPTDDPASHVPDRTHSELQVNFQVGDGKDRDVQTFDLYVGPKDHRSMRANYEGRELERFLELSDAELAAQRFCCVGLGPVDGLVKLISKAVVWVLSVFGGIFGNMGAAIIVLTILVRTLMFPVTRKSQISMQVHAAKMAKIKPKIEALKKKYEKDQQRFASEQMKLMKAEKVPMLPLGGCLPVVLQIPIFFGLFSAIRFDVDLRHAGFLWCHDLSMPDSIMKLGPWHLPCCFSNVPPITGLNVLPLLMIAAMFLHQLGMPKSDDPQMRSQQKMMMFMPLMFGVMMYGYAGGLSLYWLSSSLFGIFEQRVIKKFFPLEKALAATNGGAPSERK